ELVALEAGAHDERAARKLAVLLAAVGHKRVLGTGRGADRVDDVEELDLTVAVRRQPLPPDTGGEVDHAPRLGPLDEAVVAACRRHGPLVRAPVAEDVAHRHPELGDDRVERADRRVHAVELDLRDETRRDADPARELAQADAEPLALGAQAVSGPGG